MSLLCNDLSIMCRFCLLSFYGSSYTGLYEFTDVASDVGVNLCNVKSCLNTSNNEIFTNKRGDLPCVNISKQTCPVVK